MDYQKRKQCVICESDEFVDCFNIINTINIVENLECTYNDNEVLPLNFIGCVKCGCVQLYNLYNPELIYNQKSHYTDSGVWTKHNDCFANFIETNIVYKNEDILEIGGGSGKLAKSILHKVKCLKGYKILDISTAHINKNKDIEYIEGNCDFFDFESINVDTVVMSHVFEHLYEPRTFLNNIKNSKIKEVFISIPDMENLTRNGDINNLHIQHTFYVDTNFISWIFGEYNFELKNEWNYENNSAFYHFVKNDDSLKNKTLDEIKNIKLVETLKNFYSTVKENVKRLSFVEPFFICPSGFYGKIIYHYLDPSTKKNVIGFLDSDSSKVNKRLSGTDGIVYNKEYVKSYTNANVLLIAEKYNKEIQEDLIGYNNSIQFHFF